MIRVYPELPLWNRKKTIKMSNSVRYCLYDNLFVQTINALYVYQAYCRVVLDTFNATLHKYTRFCINI